MDDRTCMSEVPSCLVPIVVISVTTLIVLVIFGMAVRQPLVDAAFMPIRGMLIRRPFFGYLLSIIRPDPGQMRSTADVGTTFADRFYSTQET